MATVTRPAPSHAHRTAAQHVPATYFAELHEGEGGDTYARHISGTKDARPSFTGQSSTMVRRKFVPLTTIKRFRVLPVNEMEGAAIRLEWTIDQADYLHLEAAESLAKRYIANGQYPQVAIVEIGRPPEDGCETIWVEIGANGVGFERREKEFPIRIVDLIKA